LVVGERQEIDRLDFDFPKIHKNSVPIIIKKEINEVIEKRNLKCTPCPNFFLPSFLPSFCFCVISFINDLLQSSLRRSQECLDMISDKEFY
jgi:hypothetical protein